MKRIFNGQHKIIKTSLTICLSCFVIFAGCIVFLNIYNKDIQNDNLKMTELKKIETIYTNNKINFDRALQIFGKQYQVKIIDKKLGKLQYKWERKDSNKYTNRYEKLVIITQQDTVCEHDYCSMLRDR